MIVPRAALIFSQLTLYNISWLLLVVWHSTTATIAASAIIVIQLLLLFLQYKKWTNIITCLALITLLGFIIDSSLIQAQIFSFASEPKIIPLWLILLWVSFSAATIGGLQHLLSQRYLMIVAGATLGPISYAMGEKLKAVIFLQGLTLTVLILSLIWAILLPLFIHISKVLCKKTDSPYF